MILLNKDVVKISRHNRLGTTTSIQDFGGKLN